MKTLLGMVIGWLAMALVSCGGSCGGSSPEVKRPQTQSNEDEWAAVLIDGERAGHVHGVRRIQDGQVITELESEISMKRGEALVSMTSLSKSDETLDGKPLSFVTELRGAGLDRRVEGVVGKNGSVSVKTTTTGVQGTEEIPWPDGCLLPEGARLRSIKEGLSPGTRFQLRVFDFESLSCLETTYEVGQVETIELFNSKGSAHRVETVSKTSGGDLIVVSWVDPSFRLLRSSTIMMGMRFDTVACDEKDARLKTEPPAVFTRSFVDSPRVLPAESLRGSLTFVLEPLRSGGTLQFPASSEQSVTGVGTLTVTVSVSPMPVGALLGEPPTSPEALENLTPGTWIQSAEPEIIALSRQAVGNAKTTGDAALNIERFVARFIREPGLEVGYASALETARSRAGDCTEYALLTAALCRAAGIPARVVLGVVYTSSAFEGRKNFFGGHAWTQVFIDGQWHSIDSALGGFDAGHIAISYNDGAPENFSALINTLGSFRILSAK